MTEKYFHQISTEVKGNQLTICLEKDKRKRNKLTNWEPPCDCDIVEIKRPTRTEGAKIFNSGNVNQVFLTEQFGNKSQALAYKIKESVTDGPCRKITVCPALDDSISQEVQSDHINEGDRNIYLLRVQKKGDGREQKGRNLELELWTPNPPIPPKTTPPPLQSLPKAIAETEKPQKTGATKKKPSKKGKKKKKK